MCPLWVKNLLFHKYTLSNVSEVIKYFFEEAYHSGPFDFFADDVSLEPYSNVEIKSKILVMSPIKIRIKHLEGNGWVLNGD